MADLYICCLCGGEILDDPVFDFYYTNLPMHGRGHDCFTWDVNHTIKTIKENRNSATPSSVLCPVCGKTPERGSRCPYCSFLFKTDLA